MKDYVCRTLSLPKDVIAAIERRRDHLEKTNGGLKVSFSAAMAAVVRDYFGLRAKPKAKAKGGAPQDE